MNNEINLKSLIASMMKHVVWLIMVPIVCACIMFAVSSFEESTYSASATFMSVNHAESVDYIASSVFVTQYQVVGDYIQIMKSDSTLSRVAQNLATKRGISMSISEIRAAISVVQPNKEASEFVVTATCSDPKRAENIVGAINDVYIPIVEKTYERERIVKSLSKEFKAVENKPDLVKPSIIAAALGFIATFAVCFIIAYNDKTVRTEDEAKKLLDTPIIGVIPR